jgi:CRP-like cAMP-binding protein
MANEHVILSFYKKQFRADITPSQEETVINAYKKQKLRKKEVLFRPGETNTRHYLVENGTFY